MARTYIRSHDALAVERRKLPAAVLGDSSLPAAVLEAAASTAEVQMAPPVTTMAAEAGMGDAAGEVQPVALEAVGPSAVLETAAAAEAGGGSGGGSGGGGGG